MAFICSFEPWRLSALASLRTWLAVLLTKGCGLALGAATGSFRDIGAASTVEAAGVAVAASCGLFLGFTPRDCLKASRLALTASGVSATFGEIFVG
jgi:hypothetical protein